MYKTSLRQWVHAMVILAVGFSSLAGSMGWADDLNLQQLCDKIPQDAKGKACMQFILDACKTAEGAWATAQISLNELKLINNLPSSSTSHKSILSKCGADIDQAKTDLEDDYDDGSACSRCNADTTKTCNADYKQVDEVLKKGIVLCNLAADSSQATYGATAANPASSSPGSATTNGGTDTSGGGSSLGGAGMAAGAGLLGGLAGYLIGKNMQKVADKHANEAATSNPTSALQPDGSFNCATPDSYTYVACNSYNMSTCGATATATTTATTGLTGVSSVSAYSGVATNCAAFNAEYCATSQMPASSEIVGLANGSTEMIGLNGQGAGLGTGYCTTAVAAAFCTNPSYAASRANCPSCQNLSSGLGTACQSNPAACLAQNPITQMNSARTTCPDDPMFANPGYATMLAGTGTSATSTVLTGLTGVAASAKVLPPSSKMAAAGKGTSAKNFAAAALTGVNRGGTIGASMATGASASNTPVTAAALDSNRAVANVNGGSGSVRGGVQMASAAGMPSDVGGQYGPSLFVFSSQAIQQRCQSGRLNNCP